MRDIEFDVKRKNGETMQITLPAYETKRRGFYMNKEDKDTDDKRVAVLRQYELKSYKERAPRNEAKTRLRNLTRLGNKDVLEEILTKLIMNKKKEKE